MIFFHWFLDHHQAEQTDQIIVPEIFLDEDLENDASNLMNSDP